MEKETLAIGNHPLHIANQLTAQLAGVAQEDLVFALDIGTRTFIGVVGVKQEEQFLIVDYQVAEHPVRSMVDGQIEDIRQVGRVAGGVKKALEERLGCPLRHVAVAAAGRALETRQVTVERELEADTVISQELIWSIEGEGVQLAQEQLDQEQQGERSFLFYCVGYSVVQYQLDGLPIANLFGHKGKRIQVELIATFLPHLVVESLYAAMDMNDLEVTSLTLEPIAAMNLLIPKDIRLLNLALVDIGAGTSDVAICDNGSVAAYAMATVAGDEITEALIRQYLVDFPTAERIKLSLSQEPETITYKNILNLEQQTAKEEILAALTPASENLAQVIAEKILAVNGKAPAAVFLVGGGSQLPGLATLVADRLGLEEGRITVGNGEAVRGVIFTYPELKGPEFITPIGIGVTCLQQRQFDFFSLRINGRAIRLFNSREMSVKDVLLFSGYQVRHILGRSGRGILYQYNGERRVCRGTPAVPAQVLINGEPSYLDAPVKTGDELTVTPAVDGVNAQLTLVQLCPELGEGEIWVGDEPQWIGWRAVVNGTPQPPEYTVKSGDEVEIVSLCTAAQLLAARGWHAEQGRLLCDGTPLAPDYRLQLGDVITWEPLTPPDSLVEDAVMAPEEGVLRIEGIFTAPDSPAADTAEAPILPLAPLLEPVPGLVTPAEAEPVVLLPGAEAGAPTPEAEDAENQEEPVAVTAAKKPADPLPAVGQEALSAVTFGAVEAAPEPVAVVVTPGQTLTVTINHRPHRLPPKESGAPYLFVDMLNLVDVDFSRPQGNIITQLNGQQASYVAEIREGDVVEIYWENSPPVTDISKGKGMVP